MKELLTRTVLVAIGVVDLFYADRIFSAILAAGIWLLFDQPLSWASESPIKVIIVHGAWFAFWGGLIALMYWIDQRSHEKETNTGGNDHG